MTHRAAVVLKEKSCHAQGALMESYPWIAGAEIAFPARFRPGEYQDQWSAGNRKERHVVTFTKVVFANLSLAFVNLS